MKPTLPALLPLLAHAAAPLPKFCWTSLPPPPGGPRQEHGAAAVGTRIYMVGGLAGGRETARVDIFDASARRWIAGPPLPAAMHHPNVAAAAGTAFVLGGLAGRPWRALNATYRLSGPGVGRFAAWDRVADMPAPARGAAAVGVRGDGLIFLAGGLSGMGAARAEVSRYDPGRGTWSAAAGLAPLPERRDHGGGAVVGGAMYVVGGRDGSPARFEPRTWALDVSGAAAADGEATAGRGQRWRAREAVPTPRGGVAVAALGARVFVFGGEGNRASRKGVFSQVEAYDTERDVWEKVGDMRNPRHGNAAVAVGGRIYVLAGGAAQGGGEPGSIVESYGPC